MPAETGSRAEIAGVVREFLIAGLHQPIADDQDIFATGLVNSLFAAQLVMFVEERFAITVDNEDLELTNFCSVDAITRFVAEHTAGVAAE